MKYVPIVLDLLAAVATTLVLSQSLPWYETLLWVGWIISVIKSAHTTRLIIVGVKVKGDQE